MLDDRVRAALERIERENEVSPATGRFFFALVAPQTDCEVLEIGASFGYSTLWLAAAVRYLGGHVLSLESSGDQWRRNIAEAGLEDWADLVDGDPVESLGRIDDVFDVVVLAADEELFALAREKLEPGALIVADNARADYSAARQADPTLESVTVPLDRGLELSVVLR